MKETDLTFSPENNYGVAPSTEWTAAVGGVQVGFIEWRYPEAPKSAVFVGSRMFDLPFGAFQLSVGACSGSLLIIIVALALWRRQRHIRHHANAA